MDPGRFSLSRRGWTVLLWGVGLFTLIQAGLGLFLHARPSYRDQVLGYKLELLERQVAAHPDRPLVLFLGSSRVRCGVRPDVLADCTTDGSRQPLVFNYGENGTGPLYNLVCLKRLLARGIVPQHVFVEVWNCHLSPASHRQDLERIAEEPLEWSDLPLLARYGDPPQSETSRWLLGELLPVYACRLVLQHHLLGGRSVASSRTLYCQDVDALGWHSSAPLPEGPERDRLLQKDGSRFEGGFSTWSLSPLERSPLREIASVCRRQGIGLTWVYLPEGRNFQSWSPPAVRAGVDRYLDRLSRETGVACVDTRDWVPESHFIDSNHLDRVGAMAFSERFGHEVLQPLLNAGDVRAAASQGR